MKEIQLTKGYVAIVDDDDYEWLSRHKWCASLSCKRVYATRREKIEGRKTTVSMHREIMHAVKGEEIDHREGIGLDNRKQNLRRCTRTQNLGNQKRRVDNTSGYKGVRVKHIKSGVRYLAAVTFKGKDYHVGTFRDKASAARAYLAKAQELFGEFARIA